MDLERSDSCAAARWTRSEAIERLRQALLALTDDEHSMCQVAAERGIFCRGFRRWHVAEFHQRWKGAIGRSTHLNRGEMEQFANLWQLSEQIRQRVALACDAARLAQGPCRGWDEFSDAELSQFCSEVLGRSVVVGDPREGSRGPQPARESDSLSPKPSNRAGLPRFDVSASLEKKYVDLRSRDAEGGRAKGAVG